MSEDYSSIEVTVKDDGSVRVIEPGDTCPTGFSSVDEAADYIHRRLLAIRGEMHFESEHDSVEGP